MTFKTLLAAIVLFVLVAPFVGCDSKATSTSVVGTWVIDVAKTKAAIRDAAKSEGGDDKMRDAMMKGIESMIDSMAASFHVTFNADGTYGGSGGPMEQKVTGKWTLDAATGMLTATPDGGGEVIKAKASGSELVVHDDGKPGMVLVKGSPKSK